MEERAKRNYGHLLFSHSPFIFYPSLLFSLIIIIFLLTALLFKYEMRSPNNFLSLLGIEKTRDFLFFLFVIICALFVLLVLILSLGFLPSSPPLPA